MPQINFIVGEERRLAAIISRSEIEPLLKSLVKAGPAMACVLDEEGLPICRQGCDSVFNTYSEIRYGLLVEGEPQGTLLVSFDPSICTMAEPLALLARDAIQLTITNNLKRMLTTEMHTSIVQESYDQLVETNKRLSESERRYRELAISLEQKVEERTSELKKAYARMLQQEKLAAVGGLAAGMAHEINNPNAFVLSNLATLSRYVERMKEMIGFYQQLLPKQLTPLQQCEASEQKLRELKLDFILSDTEELLSQSIEGAKRIARIVADLKGFSHVDETGGADADLNIELERVLSVLAAQVPSDATIQRDLQPLPLVGCNPGLLSQAFLNIIQNALKSRDKGLKLNIATKTIKNEVVISITDNGCGIPAENMSRIFEPFFTTREVGCGTGMGLTVTREIVNDAGGTIEFESGVDTGTTVTIRIPVNQNRG
jgi:two-component system, NtrC family, sensor kinase